MSGVAHISAQPQQQSGSALFAGRRQLQRKCACGAQSAGGACSECKSMGLQRKLAVGAVNDPLEAEADRTADQVMAGSTGALAQGSPPRIQRRAGTTEASPASAAPASVDRALSQSGTPLEPGLRHDMEHRFGHDFSGVRIHSDAGAAQSARDVNAHAYTVGENVVFAPGRYAPATHQGRRLIAHELTHVVQQGGASGQSTLRREGGSVLDDLGFGDAEDLAKQLAKGAEEEVRRQLRSVGALPGTGALFSKSGCPSNFCDPFKDVSDAKQNLVLTAPFLLAGVAKVVSPRVVPLWKDYLFGGSAPQDLSKSFGSDFTSSKTTALTTKFISSQLKKEITANHAAIMGSAAAVSADLTPRMPKTLAAIDNPTGSNVMDFNVIGEIAGNIAGGVGKDQLTNKIGAKPSPFNDDRTATVSATLTRTATGIKVKPSIVFKIHDTIDLCPGNCGAVTEQDATIPMSRFEATGLSGDVPFTVEFPAPASELGEFTVAAPAPAKPKKPPKPAGGGKKNPATSPAGKKASLDQPFLEEAVAENMIEDGLDAGDEIAMDVPEPDEEETVA